MSGDPENTIREAREWLAGKVAEVEGIIGVMSAVTQEKYRSTSRPHAALAALDVLVFERAQLRKIADAAQEFIATTSVFRQPKVSRDSFEAMALLVLARRMKLAGAALSDGPGADA